jgi:arylsulfatase A-like enzyme
VNVVVWISDALRADHVGSYGAHRIDTRTIDELAAGGVRFAQCITAAPWTALAMTSIATGRYPHRHGVLDWGHAPRPGTETLQARFAAAGHAVGTFVFDEAYLFRMLPDTPVQGRSETIDPIVEWLRANAGGPFLLFVHSWATHMPYNVSHRAAAEWKDAKRRFISRIQSDSASGVEESREAYRQAIEYQSEHNLAALLDALDTLGVRDSTAIAFGADHGESWGERFADKSAVQGVYHLHGAGLWDEILHVPLIVAAPGLAPAVIESQVRTVDLAPTLLELAGLGPPAEADGASLLRLVQGGETGDRTALAMTSDRGVLSAIGVRRPPWKLVRHLPSGAEEAFRLDSDPRERVNVAGEAPPELRELLDRELAEFESPVMSTEEEAAITRRLEDLGYL